MWKKWIHKRCRRASQPKDEQDKLIERYYLNELDETELAEFKQRMSEDPAFWEAVNLHADALEALRLGLVALIKKCWKR